MLARLGVIIVCLAAVAVGLVRLRRGEAVAQYGIQQLKLRRLDLARTIWDQQVRLGELAGPQQIRCRLEQMAPGSGGGEPVRLVAVDDEARTD